MDCQFKSLQSCPRSEDHLNRLLSSLPQSLDETYERMLCNINDNLIEDARRILTLLCFAFRPLTVQELIDGVATEIKISPGLNRQRRLQDANDFYEICPGFIEISLSADNTTETNDDRVLTSTVRIAHFSVQEYLESKRIRDSRAVNFALTRVIAHAEIAQICLVYLLEPGISRTILDRNVLEAYPLAHFASMYWYHHYKGTAHHVSNIDILLSRLFQKEKSFVAWVKLHDVDNS